jgi:hypothetical protein
LTSIKAIDILKIYKFTTAIKKTYCDRIKLSIGHFRRFVPVEIAPCVRQEKLTTPAWPRLA